MLPAIPSAVVARVVAHFGLEVEVLTDAKNTVRAVTYPRHLALYLLVKSGLSLEKSAWHVGLRSHSSAVGVLKQITYEREMGIENTARDLAALEKEA